MAFVGGNGATWLRGCRATSLADTGTLAGTVLTLSFCAHLDHPNLRNEKGPPDRSRAGHSLADQAGVISSTAERGTLNDMT